MKILVVEDELVIRKNLVTLLRMEGYEIFEAENGRIGLALAREQLPALILSDVMMPDLDGYGMLEQLRGDPLTAAIPLIFLTARTDRTDVRQGMNLGADDYINKPFSTLEVLQAVSARIRRTQHFEKLDAMKHAISAREDVERIARHDLKTPLGSLAAAPALFRAGRVMSAAEESVLSMMENAANRALDMVNLSLDLYRMEEGSYVFEPRAVNLTALVLSVTGDLAAHAKSKSVTIEVSGAEPPVFVAGEDSLCYSIVANLTKNAVEAAPDHSVVRMDVQNGTRTRLLIQNEGAVPAALREKFFTKYATSGKVGGTGLGAYSAHLLAKVQGGTLTMETSDGSGTVLTLELSSQAPAIPDFAARPPRAADVIPAVLTAGARYRVLLADDDAFNRLILEEQLSPLPFDIDTAINGRDALDSAMSRRPDVIIMDIEMPVMGGIEALMQIRGFQATSGQHPSIIVAYTGNDSANQGAEYLAMGFDRCLRKPSMLNDVMDLMRAVGIHPPQVS